MTNQVDNTSTASIVIEYEISKDKEVQFRQWQLELNIGVSQFAGYLRTESFPPIKGVQEKWYIVVHFDTFVSLTRWLDSDIRHRLINIGKKNFGPYQYKKLGTGLEGWFFNRKNVDEANLRPPAWKQNFAVLFGLYPTVMIEIILFSQLNLMDSWSLPAKTFVNNIVSCSLLTWAVMPRVTRLLHFWLKPQQATVKTNLIGTLLVFIGYGFMISVFHFLS